MSDSINSIFNLSIPDSILTNPISVDYLSNKSQYQLHSLLTEQRHPATIGLTDSILSGNITDGLKQLFTVDRDISTALNTIINGNTDNNTVINKLILAIEQSIINNKKIYCYGCGATGRLSKQLESSIWRPFWFKLLNNSEYSNIRMKLLNFNININTIINSFIGEMTGADRALISSLEGFEDLQLIGELQLNTHNISIGDCIIAVTEGGETSSVIGTILTAAKQYHNNNNNSNTDNNNNNNNNSNSSDRLFYVYNNPDSVLLPYDRSRSVLLHSGISKLNLTTGPQSITGSTRMQSTSISTFTIASAIHIAIQNILLHCGCTTEELNLCGFTNISTIEQKLSEFDSIILPSITTNIESISKLTVIESDTYLNSFRSTYYAISGLMTVFIDATERSPTFRLTALDTVNNNNTNRNCLLQVCTNSNNLKQGWYALLGREFYGLDSNIYQSEFNNRISDQYLQSMALNSLKSAGNEQELLYDFSWSEYNKSRIKSGELGVLVLLNKEIELLLESESLVRDFIQFIINHTSQNTKLAIIIITNKSTNTIIELVNSVLSTITTTATDRYILIPIELSSNNDPLSIHSQIALKLLLNAHSTACMARLGKTVSNTMTAVSATNLKLIGRATNLIRLHLIETINNTKLNNNNSAININSITDYNICNSVLLDTQQQLKQKYQQQQSAVIANSSNPIVGGIQYSEVSISIIRILESVKYQLTELNSESFCNLDSALTIIESMSLTEYLKLITKQLQSIPL